MRAIGIENIPSMLAAAASGATDMAMLPSDITGSMSRPDYNTGSAGVPPASSGTSPTAAPRTKVTVAVVDSPGRATRLLATRQGQRDMQRLNNRTAFSRGVRR